MESVAGSCSSGCPLTLRISTPWKWSGAIPSMGILPTTHQRALRSLSKRSLTPCAERKVRGPCSWPSARALDCNRDMFHELGKSQEYPHASLLPAVRNGLPWALRRKVQNRLLFGGVAPWHVLDPLRLRLQKWVSSRAISAFPASESVRASGTLAQLPPLASLRRPAPWLECPGEPSDYQY